jgi:hypothetical protein
MISINPMDERNISTYSAYKFSQVLINVAKALNNAIITTQKNNLMGNLNYTTLFNCCNAMDPLIPLLELNTAPWLLACQLDGIKLYDICTKHKVDDLPQLVICDHNALKKIKKELNVLKKNATQLTQNIIDMKEQLTANLDRIHIDLMERLSPSKTVGIVNDSRTILNKYSKVEIPIHKLNQTTLFELYRVVKSDSMPIGFQKKLSKFVSKIPEYSTWHEVQTDFAEKYDTDVLNIVVNKSSRNKLQGKNVENIQVQDQFLGLSPILAKWALEFDKNLIEEETIKEEFLRDQKRSNDQHDNVPIHEYYH